MPDTIGAYSNEPGSLTYVADWDAAAKDWIPLRSDRNRGLKALGLPAPRCPDIPEPISVEDCERVLDHVARRPYSTGLWPAWDLKKDERVLIRVSNWHHPTGRWF